MKYHFYFSTKVGKDLLNYKTDAEPPRVGDYVQLHIISDDKYQNEYRVTEVYYVPANQEEVNIHIVVDTTLDVNL